MTAPLQLIRDHADRLRERLLNDACAAAGIGLRTAQSRDRTADTVRRRRVVAFLLHRRAGWTQRSIAAALGRTPRQIKRLLRKR